MNGSGGDMKYLFLVIALYVLDSSNAFSTNQCLKRLISVDSDTFFDFAIEHGYVPNVVAKNSKVIISEVCDGVFHELSEFSNRANSSLNIMQHSTVDEALLTIKRRVKNDQEYDIDQPEKVKELIEKVKVDNLAETVSKLTMFRNRFYFGSHGMGAAEFLFEKWQKIASVNPSIQVSMQSHLNWHQPTIVATIPAKRTRRNKGEIVLGAHIDSKTGDWGQMNAHSPGADDNASGVAVITEVLRVLAEAKYVPKHTIHIVGYSASEYGLEGSKEYAMSFYENEIPVRGTLNFDMTNYKGSEADLYLIMDETDDYHNKFILDLMQTYQPEVSVGTDVCGHACSDHVSWTLRDFPASYVTEAKIKERNPARRTRQDTIYTLGNDFTHSVPFTKLGISYVIEIDR